MALTLTHKMKEVMFGWTEGFQATARQIGIKVEWPEGAEPAPDRTAATNTVIAQEEPQGLASLIGKYNDDPSWEEFPAFLEQYRREIDEMSR